MNASANVDEFSEEGLARFGKRLYNNYSLSRKVHEKRETPGEVYVPRRDLTCLFRALQFHVNRGSMVPLCTEPGTDYQSSSEPVEYTFSFAGLKKP